MKEIIDKIIKGRDLSIKDHKDLIRESIMQFKNELEKETHSFLTDLGEAIQEFKKGGQYSPDKHYLLEEIIDMTGIVESTLWKWIESYNFPPSRKTMVPSKRKAAAIWDKSAVQFWMENNVEFLKKSKMASQKSKEVHQKRKKKEEAEIEKLASLVLEGD